MTESGVGSFSHFLIGSFGKPILLKKIGGYIKRFLNWLIFFLIFDFPKNKMIQVGLSSPAIAGRYRRLPWPYWMECKQPELKRYVLGSMYLHNW
jgi:hypothetical protein